MWGGYPVFVGLKDYEKSLKEHIRIVNEGCSMCIFPEGRTTQDGRLQAGKGGITYLAHKTGRPIIPVTISGTYGVTFWGFYMRKYYMSITYGKPVYVKDLEGSDQTNLDEVAKYKEMSHQLMNKIGASYIMGPILRGRSQK